MAGRSNYPVRMTPKKIRRIKARQAQVEHRRPLPTIYRAAALSEMKAAQRALANYRREKARIEHYNSTGPHRPWCFALLVDIRRAGGEQRYLDYFLSCARYYLQAAHRFGELAVDFRLP